MIVIVDYGVGNLGSILNMLKKIGAAAMIGSDHAAIETADKIILPGVGSFGAAMGKLHETRLIPVLEKKVIAERTPILGICLGMQLLTQKSAEGNALGLGWINAETTRFDFSKLEPGIKIPHMGWNNIVPAKESPLFQDMYPEPRFYFVHSYHLVCYDERDILSVTEYGYPFASMIHKGNIYGAQFHPEKSHKYGLRLLKNFAELV